MSDVFTTSFGGRPSVCTGWFSVNVPVVRGPGVFSSEEEGLSSRPWSGGGLPYVAIYTHTIIKGSEPCKIMQARISEAFSGSISATY